MHVMGTGETFDLFLDPQLKLQRVEFVPGSQRNDNVATTVYYAMPFALFKTTGTSAERRRYAHAHPTDLPVYAALEQRSQAAGPLPFHEYHLSSTGPGTGLVVERRPRHRRHLAGIHLLMLRHYQRIKKALAVLPALFLCAPYMRLSSA